MFGLGASEVIIVLVIALIFIGPKKLPELAKNLGKGFREFQNAMRGINQTLQNPVDTNTQDNTSSVPYEEQFKDDPPHDQNKPHDEEEAVAAESHDHPHDPVTETKEEKKS